MIADTIRDLRDQVPFKPFVIRASSGEAYRVESADLLVLMKSKVFIAAPKSDKATTIPYLHVAGVEELANGEHKRAPRGRRRR